MAQFEIRRALPQDVQRNSSCIISAGNGSTVILLRGKWRRCGASASSPACLWNGKAAGASAFSTMLKQLACAGGQHAPSGVRC